MWCQINIRSAHQLASFTRVLKSPNTTFHYARAVRRLNLSSIRRGRALGRASRGSRNLLSAGEVAISRLFIRLLSGVRKLLRGMTELHSLDLSGCREVDDRVLVADRGFMSSDAGPQSQQVYQNWRSRRQGHRRRVFRTTEGEQDTFISLDMAQFLPL